MKNPILITLIFFAFSLPFIGQAQTCGTISANGPVTFCQGSTVTLTAPLATAYLWSSGQTTRSIVVSAAGTFTVHVTNSNGCTGNTTTTKVTVNSLPRDTLRASGATTFCQGGSVTLTSLQDSLYHWSTGATTQAITVSSSGTYTVTVTNNFGCSAATAPEVVTVQPLPIATITANGPINFCQGGSVNLSVPIGNSYHWSNGQTTSAITVTTSGNYSVTVMGTTGCSAVSGTTVVTVNPSPKAAITPSGNIFCGSVPLTTNVDSLYTWSTGATTQSIIATASGVYSVTVTNNTHCTASASDTITVFPIPNDSITINGPLTFCAGGSVTLSVPTGNTYHWSNGQSTSSITVTTSGSYVVTVTSSKACTAVSGSMAVTVNPLPTVVITPGSNTFCGSVVLTANVDSLYKWNTGAISRSITATSSGIYSVTVSNDSRCTASASDTITISAVPGDSITANGPLTFCAGDSIILSVPSGNFYRWSNGQSTSSITVANSGSYAVTVTGSTGCSVASGNIVVTVSPNPTITIVPQGPITFCQGDSIILNTIVTDSSGGAFTYAWNNSGVETRPSITVKTGGNYSVTVVDNNRCSASSQVTVTAKPSPTTIITPVTKVFCGSATLTVTADSVYKWNTGAITQSITTTSSGNYTVTVTDDNKCSAVASDTIIVSPLPIIIVTPNGPLTFCQGDIAILTAGSYFGDLQYHWSSGQNTPSIVVTSSGNYSVTATDSLGCSGTSDTITVIVNPSPTAAITPGTKIFCGTATLTVTPDSLYDWNTGANTQSITVTNSGNYSVTVTNEYNCTATATDSIIVNNAPSVYINPRGPINICKGDSVILTTATFITSISDTFTYAWNTGETTPSITVFNSGSYVVTLTDADGCSSSSSVSVTVHQLSNIIIIDSTTTLCENDSLHLTVNAGLIYQWSTQQNTPVITIDTPGTYSLFVVDSFRCITRDTIVIPQLMNCCNKFLPQFAVSDSVFCSSDSICFYIRGGTDFALSIDSAGVSQQYISGTTPYSFCGAIPASMNISGYYTLTAVIYVRDSNGVVLCADTIRRTIYIKPSCSCACMCAETCPYLHADFTYTVYQGYMVLRDSSVGDPTFDEWFIGGQTFVTGLGDSLVYTFQHSGFYTVCLTIHHLVYGSDLCCLADTCKTFYGPVDTCSILHLNAGFTFASNYQQQLTYSFTPISQNTVPNVVIWNFGDSTSLTTDSASTVTHTYASNGTYQVCVNQIWLLPGNYCCIDSQCATVDVGLIEVLVKTSPNPFKNNLSFQFNVLNNDKIQLELFDAMGQLQTTLINSEYYTNGVYTKNFDLSSLTAGIYTYRYRTAQGIETGKIIKE